MDVFIFVVGNILIFIGLSQLGKYRNPGEVYRIDGESEEDLLSRIKKWEDVKFRYLWRGALWLNIGLFLALTILLKF